MKNPEVNISILSLKLVIRAACTILFLLAGISHFQRAESFEQAMPPWIPFHHQLVLFTGVCEVAGAVGLAIPKFAILARNCLAVFLVAVFPVNVHMAMNSQLFPMFSPMLLWLRLPLQLILIAAIAWSTPAKPAPQRGS
jgi:uncharacterized membrane protein